MTSAGFRREFVRFTGLFRGGPNELAHATEKRVPFLDALRSTAVLLVVNQHVSAEFARRYGENAYTRFPLTANGWIGVDLFFVLSGYFIGSQLWKELDRTGTVSVGRFMVRRGLRIWPLYFFVFAIVTVFLRWRTVGKEHGWSDLVFLTNYLNHGIVMGSWSLCSEEQFYLLAPVALLLIGRRSMRAYRRGLAALLGLVCLVRGLVYFHLTGHLLGRYPAAFSALYFPFHTHCDGLITGLIVANLAVSKERLKGWLGRPALLVGLALVLLAALSIAHSEAEEFAGLAIFFAALVWWGVKSQTTLFGQHIFYLLSRLSFGMYLNHEYMEGWIVGRVVPALGLTRLGPVAGSAAAFFLIGVSSAAMGGVTFCLVEHPFLMIRSAVLGRRMASPLVAH